MCAFVCSSASGFGAGYEGVWAGTIGKSQIRACFQEKDSNYYYLKHLRPISLLKSEQQSATSTQEWQERVGPPSQSAKFTGSWTTKMVAPDRIEGTWFNPTKADQRPITLKKVGGVVMQYNVRYCDTTFLAPFQDLIQFSGKTGSLQGVNYRIINLSSIEGFEIPNQFPGAAAINEYIRTRLFERAKEAYSCEPDGQGWFSALKPTYWTKDWIVIEDNLPTVFCGPVAHGHTSNTKTTWDAHSGKVMDTWMWIQGGRDSARVPTGPDARPPGLLLLIDSRIARDECRGILSTDAPYPSADGLVFPVPYAFVRKHCDSDVLVSFKDIQPYLSPLGGKAIKRIAESR